MPEGPPRPRNAFGQELPLSPEQDYPGQLIQALLGIVGLGDSQAKSNLFGQLLGAAVPFVGATRRIANPIKAYHGSPHDFDAFSLKNVGTGEGAQAYGHGLYFAENPRVAEEYVQKLTQSRTVNDPQVLAEYFKPGNIVSGYGGRDKVLEFRPNTEQGSWSVVVQRMDAKGNLVERPRVHATAPSNADVRSVLGQPRQGMYEVNIHASPEQMLDWDKPLHAQSLTVQERLRPALEYLQSRPLQPWVKEKLAKGTATGHDLYMWLSGEQSFDVNSKAWGAFYDKAAGKPSMESPSKLGSAYLNEAGVPGVKYLDAGSRSGGEGTSNYVLFRDDIIEIAKKYGLAFPFAKLIADKMKAQTQGQTY